MQGKGLGTAIPVFVVQAGTLTASTTVDVVNSFACLTKISLVAYTGATWLSPPASISPVASVTAQLRALQVSTCQQSSANLAGCCPAYVTTVGIGALQEVSANATCLRMV